MRDMAEEVTKTDRHTERGKFLFFFSFFVANLFRIDCPMKHEHNVCTAEKNFHVFRQNIPIKIQTRGSVRRRDFLNIVRRTSRGTEISVLHTYMKD
jgi:hypothetical protein